MEYLINSQVRYRTDDGAIWPVRDDESVIILTITMNRLLVYLLERQGQVVKRDELLNNVWDLHGLRSSSHTLNKYISEIRKHFMRAGIHHECITTIPRVGFVFNSDVEVIAIDNAENNIHSDTINAAVGTVLTHSIQPLRYKAWYAAITLFIIICSTALIISGNRLKSKTNVKLQDAPVYFLFNYQTCPVYTTQKNSASFLEQKKKVFLDLVNVNKIECLNGTSFLYQASDSYMYGSKGRIFISRCTSKKNKYLSCLNNYWTGYEQNQ
ncbi:transcriptional regulator [Citrobacter amalonaticus]|uniref:Transcriptional regulator n=1 Tax=Citrobacter amalonaticus TaxID=35703 RepID=A0A2S4RTV0_CITAM|nr:winged helix-turn-helix domain-containing protein [Citrobacter amalonaticus]POT57185.1 transcriptional regulator [Citrobacter amalonaticus]POT72526.1 transcriptional regulator [Citrobacter amalonaticus]POU63381.1 transcriptional regulator [Citrobacter amalonaticus]POV03145.1 transcriptional regulator [Citrobacter amalonaticus]